MAITSIRGKQIVDGSVQRADLDTTTVGQAVTAKIIQGSGISLSSTGADAGTGDVTVNTALTGLLVPTGTVLDFAGGTAPTGFLLADGSAVSRTTYSGLYTVLGGASSPWGQGDGSTTFNVPDLRGRTAVGVGQGTGLTNRVLAATGGEEAHLLSTAEMPAHNHTDSGHNHSQNAHTHTDSGHTHGYRFVGGGGASVAASPGAIAVADGTATSAASAVISTVTATNIAANAVITNTGGGGTHNTMPPFIALNKIIKT